jgi:type I restriction enzyme S subunit
MRSEWRLSTINEICSLVTDGAHNSPKSVINGAYMASVKDFTEYGLDFSSCRMISEEDYEKLRLQGCVPEFNDILVGKDGARYFEDIIIYKQPEKPALLSSIAILRTDRKKVIPEFLYYTLKSPSVRKDVRDNYGSGSAIPRIVLKDFKRMPIAFPPIDEQKKLVSIFVSIDEQIQNNNKINNNLEQQAQTLYKSWFVDFELNSGVMPSDWKVSQLGSIANISTEVFSPAKNPNVEVEHYSIPAYDEKHYPIFETSNEIKSNKYRLTSNSVMISKLNPDTKRIWRPYCISDNPICSTEFIVYEPIKPLNRDFIYSIIDSIGFSAFLCSHTTGSTNSRQRANPGITLTYDIVVPDKKTIQAFCSIVSPMYDTIENNIKENQKLAETRDKLLPKLMSGELDVSDIEL